MNEFLRKIRAKTTLMVMSKGETIKNLEVLNIPKKWDSFKNTLDKWVSVRFPETEEISSCIYHAIDGSIFPPHKHNDCTEHFTILNEGGEVEVITKNYVKKFKFPESVFFQKGEVHAVNFIKETKILCIWHPKKDDSWVAELTNNEEKL